MIRKIIRIDKEKCNGCGACADACHEGAIDIINGKAELVREHFCDGLGDCLPECPTGAISFEEREAPEYDEKAVKEAQKKILEKNGIKSAPIGSIINVHIKSRTIIVMCKEGKSLKMVGVNLYGFFNKPFTKIFLRTIMQNLKIDV